MRNFSLICGALMGLGLLAQAAPAAADIPPEGSCSAGELGQPCDNAVDESGNDVGAGVCVADTCRRATPDGPMTYDCVMCRPKPTQPNTGGAGNDPVEPGAGNAGEASAGRPASSAGTSGTGTAGAPDGGKGGTSATAGTSSQPTKKPDSDDEGGCSLSSGARRTGSLAALTSLLVVGVTLSRRRSRKRMR